MPTLNISSQPDGSKVSLATNKGRYLFAVEDSGVLEPSLIELNTPSTLSATENTGAFLVLSHKNWMNEAATWASYRQSQGMTTKVVSIEDVFDEFSYGSVSTDGMRAFLQYAKNNWSGPPQYVLLAGDAVFDFRNYEARPTFANFIPTRLVDTLYEETGSDDALVDFNDDGLAEIPIGRVAVRDAATMTLLYNKTVNFEATVANALATRGALFAFDEPNGYDFEGMSNRLRNQLPPGTPTWMVYRFQTDARNVLINQLNTGKYIVNYSGHGSTGIWAATAFFSGTDAFALTNGSNLTVFTMLTCLNGYFLNTSGDGLSELAP